MSMQTIPTEESYKIPSKRLTCRDQTQDPKIQGPEIRNQYSPLSQMDAENSEAIPERKKQIPPFFITPMHHGQKPAKVTVEKYRGRNIVSQCQRFYGFYHSSENCFLKVHCGVCAGDHPTNECKLQPDAVRKCVNCQGNHAAFYRGCPKFPRRNPPQQKRIYPTPRKDQNQNFLRRKSNKPSSHTRRRKTHLRKYHQRPK
ncbi:hypothetical protein CEXT_57071 [Caerostris extrusa]|uniref:Gag-like protein n=1 Tax=Caerostris extrusa TaxID=172846 RepID=A0AAV4R7Z2_CAEEX|nr:hypothetical protein CEXT_57071 [Caerostris extrusa]